jgi:cob(I)alamin adenosyltransferase
MSIITKTGDDGTTGLMYNRRVPKTDARVEAYGTVDELNAAVGLARALASSDWPRERLLRAQKHLVTLMGELATLAEDAERYVREGYPVVTAAMTSEVEQIAREVESRGVSFKGWATPGANPAAGALDVARTVCRRAERRVGRLREEGQLSNGEILVYLNRLSDCLWLLARRAETPEPPDSTGPETSTGRT